MVDVVVTSGTTELTWNNSLYTWDTVPADATWDDCYVSGHIITAEYDFIVDETNEKATEYHRLIEETFNITDGYSKIINKNITVSLPIEDRLVRNSNAVMYDVVLRSSANIDISKLRTIARQALAGYEDGVEFLPGDYEYKEAIVGLVLTNNSSDLRQ